MAEVSRKKQKLDMRNCSEEELYNDIAKASDLLRKLNEDRHTREIFTDANLEKDGCKFPINKCILSVYSDMFKEFFMKNDTKIMQLQHSNPKTIAALLEFIYSGDLSVAEENVKDLLVGAIYFKIPFVEKHCRMYMKEKNIGKQEVSASRCVKKASKYFKNDHSWEILNKLNKNRFCKQSHCDVSIKCEDKVFRVHKSVICAFSNYFEKLFTTEMREKAEGTVTFKDVSAQTMQTILNFMYTGNIVIREDNVFDILDCAEYLQMLSVKGFDFNILGSVEYLQTSIKDYCSCFLSSHLTLHNFFTVYSYAQAYKVTAALEKASLFFFRNLELIAEEEEFRTVSFDFLHELLQLNERESPCEETVYKSVMSWVKYDEERRKLFLPKLMQFIKIENLSKEFLQDFVLVEKLQTESTPCMQRLITGLLEHVPAKIQNRILIFGQTPEKLGTPEKRAWTYDVKKNCIFVVNPIAKDHANCGEIAELGETLYLIGGYNSDAVIRVNVHDPNPKSCKVTSMLEKREHPRATSFNGCIYVTGGHSDDNVPTSSCERYDVQLDKWFRSPSMNRPRAHHGLVELGGLLYAVGGYSYDMGDPLDSVECFDPATGQWRMVASMGCARHGAAVVAFNGEIFAIGGCNQEVYITSVEKYTPQTNSWSSVAPVVDSRNLAAACVINNNIFILGGEHDGDIVLSIEAYDPEINEWKIRTVLPSCYEICIGPGKAIVL